MTRWELTVIALCFCLPLFSFVMIGLRRRRRHRRSNGAGIKITMVAIFLSGSFIMLIQPTPVGAEPMDPADFYNLPESQLLPKWIMFRPDTSYCDCDGMGVLHMPEGYVAGTPQGKALVSHYGGLVQVVFNNPVEFRVSSPDAALEMEVDARPYAETYYLTKTGTALVLHIDAGQNIDRLKIQIKSSYPTLDPFQAVKPRQGYRYFPETGHNVSPGFMDYWENRGGLTKNGFPISEPGYEVLEDGKMYLVQTFERARFEYHPENPSNMRILLGHFGRRIYNGPLQGADPAVAPIMDDSYHYDKVTGHNIPERFWQYWIANGDVEQFGHPISEAHEEKLENGQVYLVQYFERSRLEYHPENPEPYKVLLGLFGREILAEKAAERITTAR